MKPSIKEREYVSAALAKECSEFVAEYYPLKDSYTKTDLEEMFVAGVMHLRDKLRQEIEREILTENKEKSRRKSMKTFKVVLQDQDNPSDGFWGIADLSGNFMDFGREWIMFERLSEARAFYDGVDRDTLIRQEFSGAEYSLRIEYDDPDHHEYGEVVAEKIILL